MKITINFDTNDEIDKSDYEIFNQSRNMYLALDEFKNWLRSIEKYSDKIPTFDEVYDKFYEIVNDNNVKLDI